MSLDAPPRTFEDRLALAAPGLYRLAARLAFAAWLRLPPGSRLRRAVIARQVQRAFNAFSRKDPRDVLANTESDFVWDGTHVTDWPERALYRGHEEFLEFIEDWSAAFGEYRAELEDVRDLGQGRILAVSRLHVTGGESGVAMAVPWAQIFTLRRGLVSRVENYSDPGEAVKAVGPRA